MTSWARRRNGEIRQKLAKPYCKCYDNKNKTQINPGGCNCGEQSNETEWQWENPRVTDISWVTMSNDQKQVTFHPFYSSGTALVQGDTPLVHDYHYYWEIKMLTEPYGTDIMVGVGTDKVDRATSRYRFTSLLGQDAESYGLSYTGAVRHGDQITRDGPGFCRGTIIGVKVNLWQGTLEFFLNREPRGVSFFNLRRHPSQSLYPMVCSTAAQSSMRLIYAGSWQASLLVDASKILGASVNGDLFLPPGLRNRMKEQFWLTLPNNSCVLQNSKVSSEAGSSQEQEELDPNYMFQHSEMSYCRNDYYTDSVHEDHRIAIIYNDIQ